MGALADLVAMGDSNRLHVAAGDGHHRHLLLQAGGLVDLSKSLYRARRLPWLSHLVGRALSASGWSARPLRRPAWSRLGAGNLRRRSFSLTLGLERRDDPADSSPPAGRLAR